MIKIVFYWLFVIVWCGFIFFLSSKPGLAVATGFLDFATRKPAHVMVYLILFILLFNALSCTFNNFKKTNLIILSFAVTVLYGISDEIHQSFVPLREGKVLDIIFDALGAVIGSYIIWTLQVKTLPKPKNWPQI
jgi:VanZ family protein